MRQFLLKFYVFSIHVCSITKRQQVAIHIKKAVGRRDISWITLTKWWGSE
jgi:hypothetical protein